MRAVLIAVAVALVVAMLGAAGESTPLATDQNSPRPRALTPCLVCRCGPDRRGGGPRCDGVHAGGGPPPSACHGAFPPSHCPSSFCSSTQDLGESVAVNESEDDSEEVGDMGSYAATKKKLEGKIKKIQAALKKKKVAQCLPVVDLPAGRTSCRGALEIKQKDGGFTFDE